MIDPNFHLNTDTAPKFKQALVRLMGKDFFNDNEVDEETIRKEDSKWYILTGDFFDPYKGFVATASDNGTVQKVEYDLKAITIEE